MYILSKHANLNECKKTKYKHCQVGLLEITPSISEKPACSRTEEEMIHKITKRGKRLEKDKKLHYRWSMLRNSPDFVWEIDCTTSSNVQGASNRHNVIHKMKKCSR